METTSWDHAFLPLLLGDPRFALYLVGAALSANLLFISSLRSLESQIYIPRSGLMALIKK